MSPAIYGCQVTKYTSSTTTADGAIDFAVLKQTFSAEQRAIRAIVEGDDALVPFDRLGKRPLRPVFDLYLIK